jgi:hypothetical protein
VIPTPAQADPAKASEQPSRQGWPITAFSLVVIANYLVQIPYVLDLYGTAFSRSGAALLGATLAWFLVASWLVRRRRGAGYWLLLGYALVQVVFYFDSEIVISLRGFGPLYHLTDTADPIVWLAFLVGDLNFLVAVIVVAHLVRRRRRYLGAAARPPSS